MAVNIETFRELISEGQEILSKVQLYNRPFEFEENGRYVFVGVRQAGKSYMLFKRAKMLLDSGHAIREMVYVDFDDERLLNMDADDFDLILQAYGSLHEGTPILLFDEIQNVNGWEHFARRLANRKFMVYITGSNAKMLARDIQTTLGGRYISADVFPYAFNEYLSAQNIVLPDKWEYSQNRDEIRRALEQYYKWGGFPELLLFQNKRKWLNDLYEKILLGDIILRNKIKNELALRLAIKHLAESVMHPISLNRLTNLVKGTGVNTNVTSIGDYLQFASDAFMIFHLQNYASKFVEKETVKKYYFTDNGLLSIFLSGTESPLLENLCAIHLYRQFKEGLYYYKNGTDVDFYIPEQESAIQVSYSLSDKSTEEREIEGLVKFNRVVGLKHLMIVTYDEERVIEVKGLTIRVVPVWKWLLGKYDNQGKNT